MSKLNLFDRRGRVAALLGAAALVACGGGGSGGGGDAPAPPTAAGVPPGATSSVGSWTAFARSLAPSDTDEPLAVDGVVPPVSDSADPEVVI